MEDMYTCTPREAREFTLDCIESGLVPFLQSSPGVGKSSIMRSICQEVGLELIDHRLSTSAPEDLNGLPEFVNRTNEEGEIVGRKATFTPFDLFPLKDTPIPKGKDGWMIFFDEANSASKAVQAASYKPVLDKFIGQHRLHERTVITMAGNLITDRAIVQALSTAMQSRVVHIKIKPDLGQWIEDVALPQDYDDRILAYLNFKPEALMDFRPDHTNSTFCCPRTWEFMNNLVKGRSFGYQADGTYEMERKLKLYAGTITPEHAAAFIQFTKVEKDIPKLHEILSSPSSAPVPHDGAARWMVITKLMRSVDDQNFSKISEYVNRYPMDFRILFFRGMLSQQADLRHHPVFRKAAIELQRYLNPTLLAPTLAA